MENMNKLTLNIGLGNNPLSAEQITNHFKRNFENDILAFEEVVMEWDGNPEPTLVVEINSEGYFLQEELGWLVNEMCHHYTQDAIAWELNGEGVLTYRSNYEGERYEFDRKYFKSISN
jgi:hypothetical protein